MIDSSALQAYGKVFRDITLDVSDLTYRCNIVAIPKKSILLGLISFSGTYNSGSAGTDDGQFVRWRTREFCDLVTPHGRINRMLVDFTSLKYEYGDDLGIGLRSPNMKYAVVVNPECLNEFQGVLGDELVYSDVNEVIFELLE